MAECLKSKWRQSAVLIALTISSGGVAFANLVEDASAQCDQVIALAARETGVPVAVRKAMQLTETGRRQNGVFRPWPQAVNMEGKGLWVDSYEQTLACVKQQYARGACSFDMSCAQFNNLRHHQNLASLEEMFAPVAYALSARKYLGGPDREKADWITTAGAFRSHIPKRANSHAEVLARNHTRVGGDGSPASGQSTSRVAVTTPQPAVPATPPMRRVNTFPRPQVGPVQTRTGSPVPLAAGGGRSLLDEGEANG